MNHSCGIWRSWRLLSLAASWLAPFFAIPTPGADRASGILSSESSARPISVIEARNIAVQRNWDLLAAAAGVDAAAAQKIVAQEFPNPTLSLSSTKIRFDRHPNSTTEGNGLWERSYDTVAAVNQLLEIGGKRHHRRASARAGLEAARAQFLDASRNLELGVTKAYVAVVLAEENARVQRQSAASLRKEASLADLRVKAGEISTADKSQIQITADRFELDTLASESAAKQARVALEFLLGFPKPKGMVALSDGLDGLCAAAPTVAVSDSGNSRPDVRAAEALLKKAEADIRLQRANRIPDPTFLGQYEHEPPDAPNTLGLGVSFPLPLWNHNRGNILAAEATRDQAQLSFEKIRAQAASEIATARLAYDAALLRWTRYRDTILPRSEEIRKTLSYSYEKGGASLLDLLLAERNDNEVRLALAQAASDTAVALATLKAASFEMPLLRKNEIR